MTRVFALLSWYDEQPEHLRRCVRSLAGFADVIVSVDGAYETFPGTGADSPSVQRWALSNAIRTFGLRYFNVGAAGRRWASEVEKRAAMFEFARQAGATPRDWLLVIDADMALAEYAHNAKDRLAASKLDVAEVRWHDVQVDGKACSTMTFRSLFRALPGLTVERTHYLYTVPIHCDCAEPQCKGKRRFLWHAPSGQISEEPALDLTNAVTLHHFNSQRDPDRKQRALAYYKDRDARTLEGAGDWR